MAGMWQIHICESLKVTDTADSSIISWQEVNKKTILCSDNSKEGLANPILSLKYPSQHCISKNPEQLSHQ